MLPVNYAEKIIETELMNRVETTAGAGSVVSADYHSELSSDEITVTLIAECIEDIAVERTLP